MLAVGAFVAFLIALIIAFVDHGSHVTEAALVGLVLLSAHFAFGERLGGYWGSGRRDRDRRTVA
jgi:hypothetical protein